jgi:hypothetical protein
MSGARQVSRCSRIGMRMVRVSTAGVRARPIARTVAATLVINLAEWQGVPAHAFGRQLDATMPAPRLAIWLGSDA